MSPSAPRREYNLPRDRHLQASVGDRGSCHGRALSPRWVRCATPKSRAVRLTDLAPFAWRLHRLDVVMPARRQSARPADRSRPRELPRLGGRHRPCAHDHTSGYRIARLNCGIAWLSQSHSAPARSSKCRASGCRSSHLVTVAQLLARFFRRSRVEAGTRSRGAVRSAHCAEGHCGE